MGPSICLVQASCFVNMPTQMKKACLLIAIFIKTFLNESAPIMI